MSAVFFTKNTHTKETEGFFLQILSCEADHSQIAILPDIIKDMTVLVTCF